MTNPISIVINRPRANPVRLRHKGKPMKMEDGSISMKCLDEDNRTFWILITPLMLNYMLEANHDQDNTSST